MNEQSNAPKLFLAGLCLFLACLVGVFFYFERQEVPVQQNVVTVDIPIPASTKVGGPIDPNTAPPIAQANTPNFAIPTEAVEPHHPLPVTVSEEVATEPASTASPAEAAE